MGSALACALRRAAARRGARRSARNREARAAELRRPHDRARECIAEDPRGARHLARARSARRADPNRARVRARTLRRRADRGPRRKASRLSATPSRTRRSGGRSGTGSSACARLRVLAPATVAELNVTGRRGRGADRARRRTVHARARGRRGRRALLGSRGARRRGGEHDYEQRALIFNVTTEAPLSGRAFERFTKRGAIAFLPLTGGRAAVIWTLPSADAERALALPDRRVPGGAASGVRFPAWAHRAHRRAARAHARSRRERGAHARTQRS